MDIATGLIDGGVLLLLGVCSATDLRRRRIPNALTLGGALVGLGANAALRGGPGALVSVEGWLVGVALLVIPFVLRGIGAGDVKMLALAGAWGGPVFAAYTLLFGALVGGVLAVVAILVNSGIGDAFLLPLYRAWPRALLASPVETGAADTSPVALRKIKFPYGPALALGSVVALLVR